MSNTDRKPHEKLIQLTGGSGYGYRGWEPGQIVRNTEQNIKAGQPEWLMVVESTSEYFSDSGFENGVGTESGHLYLATCRPAMPGEAAPAIRKREWMIRRTEAQRHLELLFHARWLHYREMHSSEGEAICVQPPELRESLKADGILDWFVIGEEWIWVLTVWARPNDVVPNTEFEGQKVQGQRLPFTQELADRIRGLAKIAHSPFENGA